ncbi:MAG: 3-oxoadipate enol-lactonase [Aestuariivita sp.]|nr:3-oxoadipate enol-lactonase [Aestuariivita sp.]
MPEFLQIKGRLHHYDFRAGSTDRPIVFANSLGTDLRIWDNVIKNLPRNIPILRYDKSGHGLSEGGATTIFEFADDLAGIMDSLAIQNALVCGVSIGGMIAQVLASSRPDLAAGLLLCNTGYRIGTEQSWSQRISALTEKGLEGIADDILECWFSQAFRNNHAKLVAGYKLMLTRTPEEEYITVCDILRMADLENIARQINCPTLCVAGSEDLATPPSFVQQLSSVISNGRYFCYQSVGHLPCIEVPDKIATNLIQQIRAIS